MKFSKHVATFMFYPLVVAMLTGQPALAEEGIYEIYDKDTGTLLDSDSDSFPDITEELGGTDPYNAEDFPGATGQDVDSGSTEGVPMLFCRFGFQPVGTNLCINTMEQVPARYEVAVQRCRDRSARIATYEDVAYLYVKSDMDADYNPEGRMLGNLTGDNEVLVGDRTIAINNDPNIWDFAGIGKTDERRGYWCAHDRMSLGFGGSLKD